MTDPSSFGIIPRDPLKVENLLAITRLRYYLADAVLASGLSHDQSVPRAMQGIKNPNIAPVTINRLE
jgi:hypothetical protein